MWRAHFVDCAAQSMGHAMPSVAQAAPTGASPALWRRLWLIEATVRSEVPKNAMRPGFDLRSLAQI